jgi:hypothetical protein
MFLGRIHRDHSAPSELLTVISRLDGGPASSGAPPSSRCLRKAIKILAMRNPALGLGISLDGYIARPDGTFDFLFMPKDYSMAPFFATVDTALMGRKTFDAALKLGGGISANRLWLLRCSLAPCRRETGWRHLHPPIPRRCSPKDSQEKGQEHLAEGWRRIGPRRTLHWHGSSAER